MKLVIIDHPDWLYLRENRKVQEVTSPGQSMRLLHFAPETRAWKFALVTLSFIIVFGLIGGFVYLFFKWWVGLISIFTAWFLIRPAMMEESQKEVLRLAEKDPKFFSRAISAGALRFKVAEEDLVGIAYYDGSKDMSFANAFIRK